MGIAHEGPLSLIPDGYTLTDPVEGVRQVLAAARARPEDLGAAVKRRDRCECCAGQRGRRDPGGIDGRQHRYRDPAFRVGDAGGSRPTTRRSAWESLGWICKPAESTVRSTARSTSTHPYRPTPSWTAGP